MRCILTFESIHKVMKVERILLANHIAIQLIPTPRQISSDCGMVVQVRGDDAQRVKELLHDGGLNVEGTYILDK